MPCRSSAQIEAGLGLDRTNELFAKQLIILYRRYLEQMKTGTRRWQTVLAARVLDRKVGYQVLEAEERWSRSTRGKFEQLAFVLLAEVVNYHPKVDNHWMIRIVGS